MLHVSKPERKTDMATQQKPEVLFDLKKHTYQVQVKDSKGNTRLADTAVSIEAMEEAQATFVFLGLAKDAPGKRVAAVSLLAAIIAKYGDKIEAWKGNCDTSKGLPNELKSAFQDCETDYFKHYMDKDHKDHAKFVQRLPTADGRGNELSVLGKLNKEAQFQAFMANTRKEPSYANAKNTVLGFYGYLGRLPVGDDGNLVPPEIMRVYVQNARIIEQADNSFKGKVYALHRWLVAGENDAPPDDDLPEIVSTLREILAQAETMEKAAAVRRTNKVRPGDVVQQTKDSMDKASGKVKPEDAPGKGAKKAHEPA